MAHFGVFCPPIPGHINPLAALGRCLVRRGHRVTVFHVAELESKIRSEHLEFVGLGADRFAAGTLAESVKTLAGLKGIKSLRYAIECECRISELILESGPDAVEAAGVDTLLVDQNEPAGGTVAERLGLPFVSVCTSLPLNREPLIPPPFLGWRYRESGWARLRNTLAYKMSDRFIGPIQATLNRYRRQWKLRDLKTPDDSFSRTAQIAQMPREFDFPRRQLPDTFHYSGPWFDNLSSNVAFPFERLDGRPLIYGSIGTLQPENSDYFRIMAESCAKLEAQLVLSVGKLDGGTLPELPGAPVVVGYAPQTELLARAALTITHAGMNTTQQSLYFGVPLIAIPLTHDQPATAARLARTGAGLVIPPRHLTAQRLRSALDRVLPENSAYRAQAQRLKVVSQGSGGVERAADIAERAARSLIE